MMMMRMMMMMMRMMMMMMMMMMMVVVVDGIESDINSIPVLYNVLVAENRKSSHPILFSFRNKWMTTSLNWRIRKR